MRGAVCESNGIMALKSQVSKSQITTEVGKIGDPLSVHFMIYLKYILTVHFVIMIWYEISKYEIHASEAPDRTDYQKA